MVLKQPANLKYPRGLWLRGETDCGAIERPLGLLCAFFCTCVYSCVSGWASVRQSVHGRANVPGCTQIYCTVQLFGICHNGELKHELIPDKEQLYLKQLHYSLWTLFVFFFPNPNRWTLDTHTHMHRAETERNPVRHLTFMYYYLNLEIIKKSCFNSLTSCPHVFICTPTLHAPPLHQHSDGLLAIWDTWNNQKEEKLQEDSPYELLIIKGKGNCI